MVTGPHLNVLKLMYIFMGWWPLEIKSVYVKKIYEVYSNIGLVWFTLFTASCGLYVQSAYIHDRNNFMEALAMSFALFLRQWVEAFTCSKKSVCDLILQAIAIESETLRDADQSTRNLYKKFARHAKLKTISYALIIGVNGFLFSIFGYFEIIVDQRKVYKHRKRLLLSWLPFDTDIHYNVDFILSCIHSYYSTTYAVLAKTLFVSLLCFVVIELKMLQHSLRNFSRLNKKNDYASFCLIIKKHQSIIEFVNKFNGLVQWATFVDFLTNSLIFAVALVKFVSTWNLYIFLYLPFPILPMIWVYWEANEVQIQSKLVAFAVYDSNWTKLNEKTKRAMLLMAVRAQKALKIPVGHFYKMSTESLMQAIKVSYTYLTIFRKNV